MGLFGNKKMMPKGSDIFSPEDLQRINDVIGPKMENRAYGIRYGDFPKTLMQVVKTPEKEFTKHEWNGIIYAAGVLTKLEPDLAPILKGAIEKFRALK